MSRVVWVAAALAVACSPVSRDVTRDGGVPGNDARADAAAGGDVAPLSDVTPGGDGVISGPAAHPFVDCPRAMRTMPTFYRPPRIFLGACTAWQISQAFPLGKGGEWPVGPCGNCLRTSSIDEGWGPFVFLDGQKVPNRFGCAAISVADESLTEWTRGCGYALADLVMCVKDACAACPPNDSAVATCDKVALQSGELCEGAGALSVTACAGLTDELQIACTTALADPQSAAGVAAYRRFVNAFCGDGTAPGKNTACQVPSCAGRVCGSDGCGGSCGVCAVGQTCTTEGQCICVPRCQDRDCGSDGCAGSCGTCPAQTACDSSGRCVCAPNCTGRACGEDGCGGSCGSCSPGKTCDATGKCACVPSCAGKVCGDDGCGGSCGACAAGMVCGAAGTCAPCVPQCGGRTCGGDSCGGSCGSCGVGTRCDFRGVCACDPVAQTGCPSGDRCTWNGSVFVCEAPGRMPRGAPCVNDNCVAGTICTNNATISLCRKFCSTDADCGAGRCAYRLNQSGFGVCTNPCNPLDPGSGCLGDQACHVLNVDTISEVTDCGYWGLHGPGGSCVSVDSCSPGTTCAGSVCRSICVLGSRCPGGDCQSIAGWTRYGVCP